MIAEIISVGDELLTGMSVNTNAAFIGEKLTGLGHEVRWVSTIGDKEKDITDALKLSSERAQIVIITGGLGPTHDDITKNVIAKFFDSEIILRQDLLDRVVARFKAFGRIPTAANRSQAEVPEKAELMLNDSGTAPGLIFRKEERTFFVLPGVPVEMRRMMEKSVLPLLVPEQDARVMRSTILRTVNVPESALYDSVRDLVSGFDHIQTAFLPQAEGVIIRLTASDMTVEECKQNLGKAVLLLQERLGAQCYGEGKTPIEALVANLLLERQLTIAVAESCTGGLVSHKLTNIPGSSAYMSRGIVAYSNEAKMELLDVPFETIEKYGAVSAETALAMAEGVRKKSGADIGLSLTGIAGPGGGTAEKPVGLVFMGYADVDQSCTERHRFGKDRHWNKIRSSVVALDLVRRMLLDL